MISSSSRFVVESVFRKSGVVHSFKMVDPVLFVFVSLSSSSRFVVESVFRKSGVVHSFKMVDPVLFVFGSHVLYSRDL